jgi:hypothetical protein
MDPKNLQDSLKTLSTILKQEVKSYQDLDQAIIKLGRGEDSKAFIESIRLQSFETMRLGISQQELINIYQELLRSYTGATRIVDRQTEEFEKNKKQISELIGFNAKFGVTQQQTTQILNLFNNTMGGGSQAAQKLSDSLLIFAQRTGQGPAKIFQEFDSAMGRFATTTSERAIESFQKIQLAASRTGTSVQQVISAVERFDDIETGFQAGGQLNRVLSFMGGSFDSFKAMQATDEERAQMIYQAIAQTGDRFQQLNTEQAKRAMAKQIAESANLDIKTVMGLLNKSTNLAEDLKEISIRPPVKEGFTEEGRQAAAMRATTAEQLFKLQGQLMDLNPLVVNLSDVLKANTEKGTAFLVEFASKSDASFRQAASQAKTAEGFLETAKAYLGSFGGIKTAFTDAEAQFHKNTRDQVEGVLSRNTTMFADFKTSVDEYNKKLKDTKITIDLTPDAKKHLEKKEEISTSSLPTATDATSGVPMSRTPGKK